MMVYASSHLISFFFYFLFSSKITAPWFCSSFLPQFSTSSRETSFLLPQLHFLLQFIYNLKPTQKYYSTCAWKSDGTEIYAEAEREKEKNDEDDQDRHAIFLIPLLFIITPSFPHFLADASLPWSIRYFLVALDLKPPPLSSRCAPFSWSSLLLLNSLIPRDHPVRDSTTLAIITHLKVYLDQKRECLPLCITNAFLSHSFLSSFLFLMKRRRKRRELDCRTRKIIGIQSLDRLSLFSCFLLISLVPNETSNESSHKQNMQLPYFAHSLPIHFIWFPLPSFLPFDSPPPSLSWSWHYTACCRQTRVCHLGGSSQGLFDWINCIPVPSFITGHLSLFKSKGSIWETS